MSNHQIVLVTGATGTLGRKIVDRLTAAGVRVRALTRNPTGANLPEHVEVVRGDLTDPSSLGPALDGVTALHLLTLTGEGNAPLHTGEEIVAAAVAAGVRRITVLGPGDGPVERAVAASGLEWTVLWPIDFMANTLDWAEAIRTEGVVREPFGGRRTASADEADVAAVVATVLVNGGHAGMRYTVTGPEALTPGEKARAIGAALGREVRFEDLTPDQARAQWAAQGWPEDGIEFMIDMWSTVPPDVANVTTTVQEVTGRPPRRFADWAEQHAPAFDGPGTHRT
ncbi:MAG: NmrA family NAD(P)-binding protein [Saccharothrix sp.]|nr:NmrA family NAD(P)-binding protein [Saccharothrix sp.]